MTVNISTQTDSFPAQSVHTSIQTVPLQPTTAPPSYIVASVQTTSPLLNPQSLPPDSPTTPQAKALSDQGMQTDVPSLAHDDFSPQPSVSQPSTTPTLPSEPLPLSWADDLPLLPDIPAQEPQHLKSHVPRNFSSLRSTSVNPFTSIRHQNKQSSCLPTAPPRQALYRHPFHHAHRV